MLPRGLLKEYASPLALLLRVLDICVLMGSGWVAYLFKFQQAGLSIHYFMALMMSGIITFFVFSLAHIYESHRAQGFWRYIASLGQAVLLVFIILSGIAFLTKTGELFSRAWFITWGVFSLFALIGLRGMLFIILRLMRSRGWNERRVIILGAGELGKKLAINMQQALWTGFRIVTLFSLDETEKNCLGTIPILPMPENIGETIANCEESIDEIWLAFPFKEEDRVKAIIHELRHTTMTTRLVLDIFGMDLLNHSVADFAGFPVLNIRTTPMVGMNRLMKAVEDRLLACFFLVVISPLLMLIAIAVKCSSPGPIFYRQKRVGWNGKEFEMLKFRTMPVNIEKESGPVWAKPNEERATRIGAYLRKTSLDELPQFINVLRGEMSIVGPRPERAFFVEQFKEKVPRYMQKHLVKAGITGWAQVNGWRGNTSLEKRIEYDLYYIENWSLRFDLRIIFLTFWYGLMSKNAY